MSKPGGRSIALMALALAAPSGLRAQTAPASSPPASLTEMLRYESTGLSLLRPYERGKVPVVLVHGLWSHPSSWDRLVETLGADRAVRDRYQFWTFGYSTGDPIPYSAYLLRKDLDEVRDKVDPGRADAALDRMVVVGHSLGGLLAKLMTVDASDRIWRVVSDRPPGELAGEKADVELFRSAMVFRARPEVRRVVFIATPHRGSRVDRGSLRKIGTRLVRTPDPLRATHDRLVSGNPPGFFTEEFRKGIPTSIDELGSDSPILNGLAGLSVVPAVKAHSIIAVRRDSPPADRTDGLVTYDSAHLDGVASEKVVASVHLCQEHPDVIGEVRRILDEHATP